LIYVASFAVQGTWSYYTMLKFGWDAKMVGYSLGVVGVLVAIVQGGLIRFINPKLGSVKSVYLGLVLYVVGFLAFAFASNNLLMYLALIPYCLAGICGPALQGIMSGSVPANEQGELQGSFTSLISITSIIGPPIMTSVFGYYSLTTSPIYFPGAPFILGAILSLISLLLAWNALRNYKGN
jgi:DHA1 family tetracycline resistance protein-like MFS transporter